MGYVTNELHFPTWCASSGNSCIQKYFDSNFLYDQSNPKIWEAINNVPDEEIWNTRQTMKHKLVDYIRKQFSRNVVLKNREIPLAFR